MNCIGRPWRLCPTATLTTLILVSRPEASSLAEAARCSRELAALGVGNQHLVVNGIFRAYDAGRSSRLRDGASMQ